MDRRTWLTRRRQAGAPEVRRGRGRGRRAALALAALGLVGGFDAVGSSPAAAEAVVHLDLVGDYVVTGGQFVPCVHLDALIYQPCPPSTDVVGTDGGVPVVRTDYWVRTAALGANTCIDQGAGTSVGIATAGACTFSSSGTVGGYCGLSGGVLGATVSLSTGQNLFLSIYLSNVGGVLVLKGRAVEASTGSTVGVLSGTLAAVADVQGGGIDDNCVDGGGQQLYTVVGDIAIAFA